MKKILPKPSNLPIRISIVLPNGNKIENVHVNPYDNINDIKKLVEENAVKRNDPIIKWGDIEYTIAGPLAGDNLPAEVIMEGDEEMKEGEEGGLT